MKGNAPPSSRQALARAFANAGAGWQHLFRSQRNMRIHGAIAVLAGGLGGWLGFDRIEWALLILTIGFVLAVEALNTAIEAVVDLVQPDYHPQAKIAKDVAAAGVLLAALIAVLVGLCLFVPHVLPLIDVF
ncbi:MAG: diacylglycerol kinase family protein [Chloroflexi bacterium]|nr:diacylglycerol kinase family protein [Chloroflexota bacterium]